MSKHKAPKVGDVFKHAGVEWVVETSPEHMTLIGGWVCLCQTVDGKCVRLLTYQSWDMIMESK